MSRTIFYGPKDVRGIEVRLYIADSFFSFMFTFCFQGFSKKCSFIVLVRHSNLNRSSGRAVFRDSGLSLVYTYLVIGLYMLGLFQYSIKRPQVSKDAKRMYKNTDTDVSIVNLYLSNVRERLSSITKTRLFKYTENFTTKNENNLWVTKSQL